MDGRTKKEENLWLVKRIIVGKLVTDSCVWDRKFTVGSPSHSFSWMEDPKKKKIYGWLSA
jgi:hypothetical protein